MTGERLIGTTLEAPWLPPGGSAEVWAGDDCALPQPAIIVRLLVTRRQASGQNMFFCVPGAKGLDLPTRFLAIDHERAHPAAGLMPLLHDVLGSVDVATRCVGYVRNVVPEPDDAYPHPAPWAHVPVFLAEDGMIPVVDGDWITVEGGRDVLRARHWWPIVESHLTTTAASTEALE